MSLLPLVTQVLVEQLVSISRRCIQPPSHVVNVFFNFSGYKVTVTVSHNVRLIYATGRRKFQVSEVA